MFMVNRLRVGLRKTGGFTIIELLIVIVIISILASITLISYAGVQDRAKNAAVVDAAASIVKMVQVYAATNAAYPGGAFASACVTTASGCNAYGVVTAGNTAFDTSMATVGNVPNSVPTVISDNLKGIFYYYNSSRTVDGKAQPAFIIYHLKGTSQQCGVPGVSSSTSMTTTTSTIGYTVNNTYNGTPITICYVSIPGPTS